MTFTKSIIKDLICFDNPLGSVDNSDLELACSDIHHGTIASTFDVRERTLASYTDNSATVY